jgi:hypothetical protein
MNLEDNAVPINVSGVKMGIINVILAIRLKKDVEQMN